MPSLSSVLVHPLNSNFLSDCDVNCLSTDIYTFSKNSAPFSSSTSLFALSRASILRFMASGFALTTLLFRLTSACSRSTYANGLFVDIASGSLKMNTCQM